MLDEHWSSIVKNKICITAYEIFVGNEDELVQPIPTTYLGEKFFDHSPSVQFENFTDAILHADVGFFYKIIFIMLVLYFVMCSKLANKIPLSVKYDVFHF